MYIQRNWLTIQIYKESDGSLLSKEKMLAIPQYGDYISQFESNQLWQVVSSPSHILGTSEKGNYFHNISVSVRQVPVDAQKQEAPKDDTPTHLRKSPGE